MEYIKSIVAYIKANKFRAGLMAFTLLALVIWVVITSNKLKLESVEPKSGNTTKWSTIKLKFNKEVTNGPEIVGSLKFFPESTVDTIVRGDTIYIVPVDGGYAESQTYTIQIPKVESNGKSIKDVRVDLEVGPERVSGSSQIDEGDFLELKYPRLTELSSKTNTAGSGYEYKVSLSEGNKGKVVVSIEIGLIKPIDMERSEYIDKLTKINNKALEDIYASVDDRNDVEIVYPQQHLDILFSGKYGD